MTVAIGPVEVEDPEPTASGLTKVHVAALPDAEPPAELLPASETNDSVASAPLV
jgi:hypothetical protein